MRIILVAVAFSVLCSGILSYAQSPPFEKITIKGKAKGKYNKVSLFEGGSSKEPFKTEYISKYSGEYSIDVDIASDMKKRGDYFYTDMRFWGDNDGNGMKDPGEPISQCHFIIWVPSVGIVYMQVYKGPKYRFESSIMEYNYQ
ncbi:MAG: hypothetical protein JW821_11960 [Deltaproteobacteria bacterium]|nr:hypothetical protein [Deltaproteobacteria bacterium]